MKWMDHAKMVVHALWNDADHITRLAEDAKVALDGGHVEEAMEHIKAAARPVGLVEMRWRDAERTLASTPAAKDGG